MSLTMKWHQPSPVWQSQCNDVGKLFSFLQHYWCFYITCKREMNMGPRDLIIYFKNKIIEDMIYLADQIILARSKRQPSYWLHTGWFSNKSDKSSYFWGSRNHIHIYIYRVWRGETYRERIHAEYLCVYISLPGPNYSYTLCTKPSKTHLFWCTATEM